MSIAKEIGMKVCNVQKTGVSTFHPWTLTGGNEGMIW